MSQHPPPPPPPSDYPPYGQYPPNSQYPLQYGNMMRPPSPRPTSVTVIAILAIIFGSIGVLAMLCAMPQYMGVNFMPNPVIDAIRADKPLFAYTMGSMIVSVVISMLQLIGGIGSLSLRPWAKKCLIVYGCSSLALGIIELVARILVIQPRTAQVTAAAIKSSGLAKNPVFSYIKTIEIGGYIIGGLVLLWPVLVVYYMTRPHIKEAFAREMEQTIPPAQ